MGVSGAGDRRLATRRRRKTIASSCRFALEASPNTTGGEIHEPRARRLGTATWSIGGTGSGGRIVETTSDIDAPIQAPVGAEGIPRRGFACLVTPLEAAARCGRLIVVEPREQGLVRLGIASSVESYTGVARCPYTIVMTLAEWRVIGRHAAQASWKVQSVARAKPGRLAPVELDRQASLHYVDELVANDLGANRYIFAGAMEAALYR